jgi:patatin-related protein
MTEKELRLALVCFGGVSLAIYMHGICTEILKLVRASAALHGITDRASRAVASYAHAAAQPSANFDTEPAYFDLLRAIGRKVELRVIVDIIAGASAGGINGTMLARALCHDLPIDRLSELWLDKADVHVLLAPEARAGRWSKLALKPLIWGATSTGLLHSTQDPEVRKNLSLFVRSRWFKPPFDGHSMTGLMLDAINALGAPARPTASLMPSGQRLDLFVTLTDYHGRPDLLQLHDPVFVHENEHRHVLHLKYRRNQNGEAENDFDLANGPALAFTARATSSFPGAFPPARIIEVDSAIADRGIAWPKRQSFIEKCFSSYLESNVDPTTACFIDGSVLNNRPFREAIAAIHGRPAYRQVDRRLVYIDPTPDSQIFPTIRALPGFLSTLKAAVSDLPRAQPVTDELNALEGFNDRVRNLRAIIDGARPRITRLVASVIRQPPAGPLTAEQITSWRQQVNAQVRVDAGFAYESYVQLKLRSAVGSVSRLVVDLRGTNHRSLLGKAITSIVEAWAARAGIVCADTAADSLPDEDTTLASSPRWVHFLLAFDIDYRKRRLHFLVEGQNRLYQLIEQKKFPGLEPGIVDRLKRQLYAHMDVMDGIQAVRSFSAETQDAVAALFAAPPSASDARDFRRLAERFVDVHAGRLDTLMARLAAEIDLQATSRDLDLLLSTMMPTEWHPDARYEVLVNYLGFPYWDVLTLPVTATREAGEFREILIDRVSPADAVTLKAFAGADMLKGKALGYFAGFFSRSYRENDYLLGRLHAVDRLIDIVCDAAGINPHSGEIDIVEMKKRAFSAILQAEKTRLTASGDLKAALRRSIMML